MATRFMLVIALVLLSTPCSFSQAEATPESNLYLKALSACVERQAEAYRELGGERDYINRIVEKNAYLTEKLPTEIGEYRIEFLDGPQLIDRYRRIGKPFLMMSMRPIVNEGELLKIGLVDYWISYEKRSLSYSLEGGCNVFFRYECERRTHVVEKVDLWGI